MKCPTEIAISDRREAELSKNGFMPMIHRKNSDFAAFIGGQSLQKPAEYDDPGRHRQRRAGGPPALPVRLQPLRALPEVHRARQGRLLQGPRCDGRLAEQVDPQLRRRRSGALLGATKAERPLAAAQVEVEEIEGTPGYYQSKFYLQAALPARRPDGVFAPGFQASVGEGCRLIGSVDHRLTFRRFRHAG